KRRPQLLHRRHVERIKNLGTVNSYVCNRVLLLNKNIFEVHKSFLTTETQSQRNFSILFFVSMKQNQIAASQKSGARVLLSRFPSQNRSERQAPGSAFASNFCAHLATTGSQPGSPTLQKLPEGSRRGSPSRRRSCCTAVDLPNRNPRETPTTSPTSFLPKGRMQQPIRCQGQTTHQRQS